MASVMKEFQATSNLYGSNAPYVEELYERYLADPASVDAVVARDVRRVAEGQPGRKDVPHSPVIAAFEGLARNGVAAPGAAAAPADEKQLKVLQYIRAHRVLGSRYSQLDPLKRLERTPVPELELSFYGLTEADMDREFSPGSWQGRCKGPMKLRDIVAGGEEDLLRHDRRRVHVHLVDRGEALDPEALRRHRSPRPASAPSRRRWILERITAAETLERYLHTRYVGQKRFSGEGGETHDPDARHGDRERRRARRQGSRDRHGAPRAPERAGEHPRQDPRGALPRVRGQARRTSSPRAT